MKVLILNPTGKVMKAGTRWSHRIKKKGLNYKPFPFFQAYAGAVLREAGHDVRILDCVTLEKDKEYQQKYIESFNPDLIAMETTVTSYEEDKTILDYVKCPIVITGMHGTTSPKICTLDYDYVCLGEYDYSLLELVNNLEEGKVPLQKIIPRKPVENLDLLPLPVRDLMEMEKYNEPIAKGFNVVLIASRGCPLRCSFCQVLTFYGKSNYRMRTPKLVVDEMEMLWNNYRPDELYFDDDSFTVSKRHVQEICNELLERGLDIQWGCMGLPTANLELFPLMAKAGCKMFKFGVESIDPEVIKHIPKPVVKSHIEKIIKTCKENSMRVHPTFMIGLPYSTKEKDFKTLKWVLKQKPTTLQFSVATPFPGTKFYDEAMEKGWFATKDWSEFGGTTVVISYPNYSDEEIEEVFWKSWQKWNRHIVKHQWGTIWHHLSGVHKREGICRTLSVIGGGIKNVIRG